MHLNAQDKAATAIIMSNLTQIRLFASLLLIIRCACVGGGGGGGGVGGGGGGGRGEQESDTMCE